MEGIKTITLTFFILGLLGCGSSDKNGITVGSPSVDRTLNVRIKESGPLSELALSEIEAVVDDVSNSDSLVYQWEATDGFLVTLNNTDQATVSVTPSYLNDMVESSVELSVIVTDDQGYQGTAKLSIPIHRNPNRIENYTFPDTAFMNCIMDHVENDKWYITDEFVELKCKDRQIESVEGVEHFANLEFIDFSRNKIDIKTWKQ